MDAKRRNRNLEILNELNEHFTMNPDQRFNQALINLDIVRDGSDDWYTEPEETLARISMAKAFLAKNGKKA